MRASDRHELDSRWEVIVDDALYANGLIHSPHPRYPGTQLVADFLVGDVYVEVWGMKSPKYLAQREAKERLAREMKLKLVGIEAEDLEKGKRLSGKLEEVRRRMTLRQSALPKTGAGRGPPRPSSIDLFSTAEVIALGEGALAEIDTKLRQVERQREELQRQIAELEVERLALEKRRGDVVRQYIS